MTTINIESPTGGSHVVGSDAAVHVRLRDGMSAEAADTRLRLTHEGTTREVTVGMAVVAETLARLGEPCLSKDLLHSVVANSGDAGLQAVAVFQVALRRLEMAGLLEHVVVLDGRVVARLGTDGGLPVQLTKAPSKGLKLARLAVLRVLDDGWVRAEGGRSHLVVHVHRDHVPALMDGFADDRDQLDACLADLLWSASLLDERDAEEAPESRMWSPAELWMHRQFHDGRGVAAYGGTYPLEDVEPEPFDTFDGELGEEIPLPPVDLHVRGLSEMSLAEAIEQRRSVREFSAERAPTLAMLSELLFRTMRARGVRSGEKGLDVVDRPYPSGGAIHEINTYVVVTRCDELAPGLWRYQARKHALARVEASDDVVATIAADAGRVAGGEPAPVTVLLTARFSRIMWKYQTVAYPLALKHVGVVTQNMYLVASAMGLGVCALGGGSGGLFNEATKIDPLIEGQVGALVVGIPGDEEQRS
ncbi:SagB family peptide dehydrogenase [Propioniferax innocua]|uniref:SagB-type dehydrogenase family enzyme n=1 Tax=Propioniferax innocua TaxID=1753 RepID=A0A542ZAQ9_9ACTN|nr:SagB family peptide dehydrogenase [Propioniferax innocua]TQL57330.1 SagB-type dehydrogenase family enzyme [Propioniferax innocua]